MQTFKKREWREREREREREGERGRRETARQQIDNERVQSRALVGCSVEYSRVERVVNRESSK